MNPPVLIIPGARNSGPEHWQSLWQAADPSMERLNVNNWDNPACDSWVKAIDSQVRRALEPVVVVAHSLGCLAFAHWAAQNQSTVRGALLVAVPDPDGPSFPAEATGFSPLPLLKLICKSIVVSSRDDPFGSPEYARRCAEAWGSRFVDIGCAGHINAASNLGRWSEGLQLLHELLSTS